MYHRPFSLFSKHDGEGNENIIKQTKRCHYIFKPICVLTRSTQLRHLTVKYKYLFYKALSLASPLSLLKLSYSRLSKVLVQTDQQYVHKQRER